MSMNWLTCEKLMQMIGYIYIHSKIHFSLFMRSWEVCHLSLERYQNMLFDYVTFSFIWTTFDINNNHFQKSPPLLLMETLRYFLLLTTSCLYFLHTYCQFLPLSVFSPPLKSISKCAPPKFVLCLLR